MEINSKEVEKQFISNPKVIENYSLLRELGVFSFLDSLMRNIHTYKTLLNGGLDIFNRTSTSEIMDATVKQISYHYLPSYIAFLWKPDQNRPDITIRAYRNYRPVDMGLKVNNITPFENYFQEFPKPVSFESFAKKLENDEALLPFNAAKPEIIIPILGPFGLYGIILVGRKIQEEKYTEEEQELLQQLMSFMSHAIKNYLHYERSLRDVKTGLYNHGFFMSRLKEEVAQVQHSAHTSSVVVIDVDKFKNFNDTYGHLAGDQVLEKLAQAIRQSVRNNDVPSRFGGEEFTVMLPRADVTIAKMVAERLRISVAKMHVPWEEVTLPQVTISLGVFTFGKDSNLEPEEILRRADEALYVSKNKGRNCSTVWEPGLFENMPAMALRNY
ncbi:MAG: GGDEF domain-containing protein [Treponema sp.]|jgi:diguanylate cyclase (GGDEF)-like protein|nr:GGDEF domain-containing protein [Treponema sp.]